MPRLNQRKDGGYYIHHFYYGHSTWQIGEDGVEYLKRRGIKPGMEFHTYWFFELYRRNMLWTGNFQPDRSQVPLLSNLTTEEKELKHFVTLFFSAIYKGEWSNAFQRIYAADSDLSFWEQFKRQFERKEYIISSWQLIDIEVFESAEENYDAFGIVATSMTLEKACSNSITKIKRNGCWIKKDKEWLCVWRNWE